MAVDGRSFQPHSLKKTTKVVGKGEFIIAVCGLIHGHVYGLLSGLVGAGAEVGYVYEEDDTLYESFHDIYPTAMRVGSIEALLVIKDISMVVNCLRPDVRADVTIRALEGGISVFSDKPGFLEEEDGERILCASKRTGAHFFIYFSEHLHLEEMILAKRIVDSGRLGEIFRIESFGPHRINESSRPDWFFDSNINGDILIDLGCHLIEEFMWLLDDDSVTIIWSQERNVSHGKQIGFYDFGEILVSSSSGVSGYFAVDWFTPDGLESWGDCRTFIAGTKGSLEIRKYIDPSSEDSAPRLIVVDEKGVEEIYAKDNVGFEEFGRIIEGVKNNRILKYDTKWYVDAMNYSLISSLKADKLS